MTCPGPTAAMDVKKKTRQLTIAVNGMIFNHALLSSCGGEINKCAGNGADPTTCRKKLYIKVYKPLFLGSSGSTLD